MILQERQQYLNSLFKSIEGINRRRAYISTQYVLAKEKFNHSFNETDGDALERHKVELESIDMQVAPLFEKLRSKQTRYLVEYDGEMTEAFTNSTSLNRYTEELYFLMDCEIDTFHNGWNLEHGDTQELLYEIADFLLLHRFSKFFIRNVKRL